MNQSTSRILILMVGAVVWLGWVVKHSEPDTSLGLRTIREAERIDHGLWHDELVDGIDHPLYPLGIVVAHRALGGDGPASWQRAALVLSFASVVLLVVPVYLLSLELCGETTAWLATLLVIVNPIVGSVVVNVLSETTFLLLWTFGVWGSVRFLREGRFVWLPLAIGFGALAYLTRPEGMLLPVALTVVLLALPLLPATRINWPRWRAAVVFVVAGLVFLVGPYVVIKGGVGTKPAIARVLGLAAWSDPLAPERETPFPPGQSVVDTYRIASSRAAGAIQAAVTFPLSSLSILGLVVSCRRPERTRAWLFLGLVLVVSAVALVRLHATGGYCGARHALVPAILLTLTAAVGLKWLMERVSIPGSWLGPAQARLRPGPAIWGLVIACFFVLPAARTLGPGCPGPYWVYIATGDWLAHHAHERERVLDLTAWSLYFSQRPGYTLANVAEAERDPATRWIVVGSSQVDGHRQHDQIVRELVDGLDPVARLPATVAAEGSSIQIFDRWKRPVSASTADYQVGSDAIND